MDKLRVGTILLILLVMVLLMGFLSPTTAQAHGTTISYSMGLIVEVQATFDSGEPMAAAQVNVFAPDDPENPWLTGVTDDEGRFVFKPDPAIPGDWDVQVRQAGHGDIIQIPIEEGARAAGTTGFTPVQIALMSASIIWGFIGTALFFMRRNT